MRRTRHGPAAVLTATEITGIGTFTGRSARVFSTAALDPEPSPTALRAVGGVVDWPHAR